MVILGIETSCDETAASVVRGTGNRLKVLSNVVSSQIEIHKKYGGVVPEVAAREHVLNILPVVNEALLLASLGPATNGAHAIKKIDAIAVTVGPGLITSLMVGVETAKTLAYVWNLPLVAVNHIEGHIYANFIGVNPKSEISNPKQIRNPKSQIPNMIKFPAVILTVSGGHTMLVLMEGHGKYKTLGETRDDAAGEAFDKAAQMLGLGYPGGPAIAEQARRWKSQITITNNQTNPKSSAQGGSASGEQIPNSKQIQNEAKIILPRPMIRDKNLDFSFSGLKTALFYALKQDKDWKKRTPEYAAEFQQAVIDVLIHKTIKAAKAVNCQTLMLAGGVAANSELRSQLKLAVENNLPGVRLAIPDLKYCTDNAAMIAAAGYFRALKKDFTPWQKLWTEANLEFK